MSEYLNLIQIITGVTAAAIIFAGIFITAKKLNPEKYEEIPLKTTIISTALLAAGLLFYAVTKTCTNLTAVTEEHYELGTVYFVSVGEVAKSFGFIVFIPLLFRLFKPKRNNEGSDSDIQDEECSAET